jgi:hypothetical protein
MELRHRALNAVPTAEEVGDCDRAVLQFTAVHWQAVRTIRRSGCSRATLGLSRSAHAARPAKPPSRCRPQEAFPRSAIAENDLGNAHRDAGKSTGAATLLRLELVTDPEIDTPAARAQSRANIEQSCDRQSLSLARPVTTADAGSRRFTSMVRRASRPSARTPVSTPLNCQRSASSR